MENDRLRLTRKIQLMPQPYNEGDGPAVILLHGYPFNRSMWREQIDFLSARGCRAIAPNLLEMSDDLQLVADGHRTFQADWEQSRDSHARSENLSVPATSSG